MSNFVKNCRNCGKECNAFESYRCPNCGTELNGFDDARDIVNKRFGDLK